MSGTPVTISYIDILHGKIHADNGATGAIIVAGVITTTFFDDVTMDAAHRKIQVASDSYAVFLGSYSGGSTGSDTVHAMGDLRPGHSPAVVSFGGDLVLGSNAHTKIQLSGTAAGSQYDQLSITGSVSLADMLGIGFISGFTRMGAKCSISSTGVHSHPADSSQR